MIIRYSLLLALCLSSSWAAFEDEMQMYEKACLGEDMFTCHDGGCVFQSQFCDGKIDCDDGTDENYCTDHKPDATFCNETHQFMCRDNSKCIPYTWVCNNDTDCTDGSDELECTSLPVSVNVRCKGFLCGDGKCISNLWVCDGAYDCDDRSDEYALDMCKHSLLSHAVRDASYCEEISVTQERNYKCLDLSFCLPSSMMCDGMADCKDGSDEGSFCTNWHTMCINSTCPANITVCSPERSGPVCLCETRTHQYNNLTRTCDDINECLLERPQCSQRCVNGAGHYICECEHGYLKDEFGYLCYATGPEAMLFFSTHNEIKYFKIRSKQLVTLASNIKAAHGVSSDGKYVYWVETARGHQSIVRALLNDVQNTKEVLVGLGLEDPGDIAVDWMGDHIYFSDAERGYIFACHFDGSNCTTIHADTKNPKFVTLDAKNGKMYWADWHNRPVIMTSKMDGSHGETLVDNLSSFATGLAIDAPNDRLYFVDKTIKVIILSGKHVYSLFEEPFHHPYSIAVFENTVFWSDWTSNTILTADKVHGSSQKRYGLLHEGKPVIGMHMYHPVLMMKTHHPCNEHPCSHFCFITSNTTYSCGCPEEMELQNGNCRSKPDYRPQYLIVGGGSLFTRIQYDMLGNPKTHATQFDIGRVQAMAYDSARDNLYIYDGQRKSLSFINMSEFTTGVPHTLLHNGLENVVEMDYDYVTDNLYILDAERRVIEVLSMSTHQRALVYKFKEEEIPIALCILPDYGKMLVAIVESDENNIIHVDSIDLDGDGRQHVIMNNLKGPRIRLKYSRSMDNVFLSDEGYGIIQHLHPEGTARENFREISTSISSLGITENLVFWTERRTPKLYWADIHETSPKIRRIELSIFPNNTQLLVHVTSQRQKSDELLKSHPCRNRYPCTHICVQTAHLPHVPQQLGFRCLCPPGRLLVDGRCLQQMQCQQHELYCHKSNFCVDEEKRCDGITDCVHGEDEDNCNAVKKPIVTHRCLPYEIFCNGVCVDRNIPSPCTFEKEYSNTGDDLEACASTDFQCSDSKICVARSQVCDGLWDCPDGSDEGSAHCDLLACFETEFMCTSGSCILKSWKCDGDQDCNDASDEVDCENVTCPQGYYQCKDKECIEVKKRCDGNSDCFDSSDEEDCDEVVIVDIEESGICAEWEYTCELNNTICLPLSARCNMKVDCPGGTDENGCDFNCAPHGTFACKQQLSCLPMNKVCNGKNECDDGSDETPEACAVVNRTPRLYPVIQYMQSECHDGYRCKNGQCIDWKEVCDKNIDCQDGSDENGLCITACQKNSCKYSCKTTPIGPHCFCPPGHRTDPDHHECVDIDECSGDYCSQGCVNTPGSFICSCHHGYALRSDRRSCKAVQGTMSVLYVFSNTVRSLSAGGSSSVVYTNHDIGTINDLAYDTKMNKLLVSTGDAGNLIEVNTTGNDTVIVTNIGRPTKVAVDWVTGNVYFADLSSPIGCIRVCNVVQKRCAKLQKLPPDVKVTAFIIEPTYRKLFYCLSHSQDGGVWTSELSGRGVVKLAFAPTCSGLAADPFTRTLYVAETGLNHVATMDFAGGNYKKRLSDHPQLQAPHGLSLFENHVYYLVADSFRLNRCVLYGPKHCETFIYRAFDSNIFVIRHPSVQRDDLKNNCEGVVCSNICTLGEKGPLCICEDGTFAKKGKCDLVMKSELALFNGLPRTDYSDAHSSSYVLLVALSMLFVVYLSLFLYYQLVYKPRRKRDNAYSEVRFQNNPVDNGPYASNPTVELGTTNMVNGRSNEFVNPLQYVKNVFQQSFRTKSRPIGTAGLCIHVQGSPEQDLSDTESDLDDRDTKRFLNQSYKYNKNLL